MCRKLPGDHKLLELLTGKNSQVKFLTVSKGIFFMVFIHRLYKIQFCSVYVDIECKTSGSFFLLIYNILQ